MAGSNLDTEWMFEDEGQVFGPISTQVLLERLYDGSLTPETPVALEGEAFRPIRQIAAFRAHLPKIEEHRQQREDAKAEARAVAKRRLIRGGLGLVAGAVLIGIGSFAVIGLVRQQREAQAEAERQAKEAALQKELDTLMASVTIEPPLEALVTDEPPGRRRRRAGRSGRSRRRSGALSRREVLRGVRGVLGIFKRCIVEQIQRDAPSVGPQIMLTFAIGNDGRAKNIGLADRFLRRSEMQPCFERALSNVRWRTFKGEVRNVEYPISVRR